MNVLTKLALGMMGQVKAKPLDEAGQPVIVLPPATRSGGMPLLDALRHRQSSREFKTTALPPQVLSDLLWAAFGINREEHAGRTAPTAMNSQEIDLYAALPEGLYRYEPVTHCLRLAAATDVRRITGYQDFVDEAPLDLVLVANHGRMSLVPAAQRLSYASVAAGAIAENIYLYCASAGLATVIRAWIDRDTLAKAIGLPPDHQILLSQTVGYPV